MGVSTADIDDDGDLDLVVCNLGGESVSLFVNSGGFFIDCTGTSGLATLDRARARIGGSVVVISTATSDPRP